MPEDLLRYPVGRFHPPAAMAAPERAALISTIDSLPAALRQAVAGLDAAQLATPYRPGGWTVRQVVHHLPDSHMNSYIRFRLALTEDNPTIKPYEEAAWAELPDAKTAPVDLSLDLLAALHARWTLLLNSMSDADYARTFRHLELGEVRLDTALALYAWHCRHHLAHITRLRDQGKLVILTPLGEPLLNLPKNRSQP